MIQREPVFAALFALLSGAAGFTTKSRRLRHWNDVPADQQPALFMAQGAQSPDYAVKGMPPRWTVHVDVYVYARAPDDTPPSTAMNPLLDAIEAALEPSPAAGGAGSALGGLAHRCWIDGTIETDEGTLGAQAVAIIPITIII